MKKQTDYNDIAKKLIDDKDFISELALVLKKGQEDGIKDSNYNSFAFEKSGSTKLYPWSVS
jgi:hypothetical protein